MARFTFNLPDIGEGIAEAEIVEWHVKVGDMIEEDDQIADMMTDKATVEMESPVSGKVVEVAGETGDVIAIGAMLVVIELVGDVAESTQIEDERPSLLQGKEGSAEGAEGVGGQAARYPTTPTPRPPPLKERGRRRSSLLPLSVSALRTWALIWAR